MRDRDFNEENESARRELSDLVASLDERSFKCVVGSGWTVSTVLCHLAFWDQRVAFLISEWQSGGFEPSTLSSQSVNSVNEAVKAISQAVPGPAAATLALDSASAVDSRLTKISDELAGKIHSAGLERYLRRALHRREHLQKMRQALAATTGTATS